MKIKDIIREESLAPDELIQDAMWWVQRWISGSMNDPDWSEGEQDNKLTVDEAFQLIRDVTNAKSHYQGDKLWRFISVRTEEADMIISNKVIRPHNSSYQSFTTSYDIAKEVAEDFGVKSGETGLIVSVIPDVNDIMFGAKNLFNSSNSVIKGWMLALEDWKWQDEVVVLVNKSLKVNDIHIL